LRAGFQHSTVTLLKFSQFFLSHDVDEARAVALAFIGFDFVCAAAIST